VVGGDKDNQTFFGVFEVFLCGIGSQHDGYHVGSMLQGLKHSGKLGGM
jgi:hypothetical protein